MLDLCPTADGSADVTTPTLGAPPSPADQTSDLAVALRALAGAEPDYTRAQQYFDGSYGEYFASVRVRRAMARTGAAFRLNFARQVVRSVVDRLEIAAITADTAAATSVLEDTWTDNDLDIEESDVYEMACEYGDAYLIVWPSAPDTDDADDLHPERATFEGENTPALVDTDQDGIVNVDVFLNAPMSVRLFYDEENLRRKSYAIKRWTLSGTRQVRVDLYYRDRIERYISRPGGLNPKPGELHPYTADGQGDEHGVIDNPFGVVPVFHFRTARPYGRPVHADFFGAQDAIHKLVVSHMSCVDYQSFPQRYALTKPGSDTSDAVNSDEDEFAFALDTGATSRAGDPQSQLSADPGSLWALTGYDQVGQFAEADPGVFMEPLQTYVRAGAQVSVTPMRYLDPNGTPPSGESLRVEEAPHIKKIERIRKSFGATWRQVTEFVLLIAGGGDATNPGRFGDATVDVRWSSAETIDDLTRWQTVSAKIAAGMPVPQAFLEAGYSQDQVDDWFGENGEKDTTRQVDLLARIAGALQAFSAAAAAGVFSEAEIRTVITAMLGEVGIDTAEEATAALEAAGQQPAPPVQPPPVQGAAPAEPALTVPVEVPA